MMRTTGFVVGLFLLGATAAAAASSEVADAAMRGDREAVRTALARKADVNAPQVDGTTGLHCGASRTRLPSARCAASPAPR